MWTTAPLWSTIEKLSDDNEKDGVKQEQQELLYIPITTI